MEWLSELNRALTYLEDNLRGDIDIERAAQLAGLTPHQFQRVFSYIAGMPLSEYLRRRRMTCAAFDLQHGARVLDVALQYGYDSPTAFTRAFKALHGVPPSAVQKGAMLKSFPPIRFQLSIKGDVEMDYRIVEKESFRIVGVRDPLLQDYDASFARVPVFWGETAAAGLVPKIAALIQNEPRGVLGLSTCDDTDNHYYIAAATDAPVPEGMFEYTVPGGRWAVFAGKGRMPDALQTLQKRIVAEWLPQSGYEWAQAPDIEVYLDDEPEQSFEVWLPIVKKA